MFNVKVRLAGSVIDRASLVAYRSPVLITFYLQGAPE